MKKKILLYTSLLLSTGSGTESTSESERASYQGTAGSSATSLPNDTNYLYNHGRFSNLTVTGTASINAAGGAGNNIIGNQTSTNETLILSNATNGITVVAGALAVIAGLPNPTTGDGGGIAIVSGFASGTVVGGTNNGGGISIVSQGRNDGITSGKGGSFNIDVSVQGDPSGNTLGDNQAGNISITSRQEGSLAANTGSIFLGTSGGTTTSPLDSSAGSITLQSQAVGRQIDVNPPHLGSITLDVSGNTSGSQSNSDGGFVNINTQSVGNGIAGNVSINANARGLGVGQAGFINISAQQETPGFLVGNINLSTSAINNESFPNPAPADSSAGFISIAARSVGRATDITPPQLGNISLDASGNTNTTQLNSDGGFININAQSFGTGIAGNINISTSTNGIGQAGFINLASQQEAAGGSIGGIRLDTSAINNQPDSNAGSIVLAARSIGLAGDGTPPILGNIILDASGNTNGAQSNSDGGFITLQAFGAGTGALGTVTINGNLVLGTIAPNPFLTTPLQIDGSGNVTQFTSSRRYKTNIRPLTDADSEQIYLLEPVKFNAKNNECGPEVFGLIAEVLAEKGIFLDAIIYDKEGRIQSIAYNSIFIAMLNEVIKLKKQLQKVSEHYDEIVAFVKGAHQQ